MPGISTCKPPPSARPVAITALAPGFLSGTGSTDHLLAWPLLGWLRVGAAHTSSRWQLHSIHCSSSRVCPEERSCAVPSLPANCREPEGEARRAQDNRSDQSGMPWPGAEQDLQLEAARSSSGVRIPQTDSPLLMTHACMCSGAEQKAGPPGGWLAGVRSSFLLPLAGHWLASQVIRQHVHRSHQAPQQLSWAPALG